MDEKFMAGCGVTVDREALPAPVLKISNELGSAAISLYGAHLLSFAPAGARPVLWMSGKSLFEAGKPIRGGVPICWPWFGPAPVEGLAAHGFARISLWDLAGVRSLAGGATQLELVLDEKKCDPALCCQKFRLSLVVTVGRELEIELRALNTGDVPAVYQGALHSYFEVSDAEKISIRGLDNVPFVDKAPDAPVRESVQYGDLEIDREIDRVFCPSAGTVEISDPGFRRTIRVAKCGSRSTVVWNPWIAKSKAMPDFGDNEYRRMLCVECANVFADARTVEPGQLTVMVQKISVEKWD